MTTEYTGGSFRQIKKKTVQFKYGRLLANYRDLCLQLPPRAERHIQHMHMRFYRCRTRRAIQCLCDLLSAGFFALLETLVDRYPLRSKAGTSFFLSQPSIGAKPTSSTDHRFPAFRR